MLAASKILTRPASLELLKTLTGSAPATSTSSMLWKYFLLCTETPRMPGNLGQFTEKLRKLAQDLHCDFRVDSVRNRGSRI